MHPVIYQVKIQTSVEELSEYVKIFIFFLTPNVGNFLETTENFGEKSENLRKKIRKIQKILGKI